MRYQAMLFDLDDTLLDRDLAVDQLFNKILDTCYESIEPIQKSEMLKKFKDYDQNAYGIGDKTIVAESLFDDFPPSYRLPGDSIQSFWNHHFPQCFTISEHTFKILKQIKTQMKVGIVTNGVTERQKAKIANTKLNTIFDHILISEEAGVRKPDRRIFEMALEGLNVQPENTLFVGDNLIWDIEGCQNVNIKGIWYNPHKKVNHTEIKPDYEIQTLDQLVTIFT